jgi:hypothetical protein
MAQDCGEIRNIRGLSPRPCKFPVAFSLNPRHMRPWCCPAGSRGANRRARCGLGQFFKSWLRIRDHRGVSGHMGGLPVAPIRDGPTPCRPRRR